MRTVDDLELERIAALGWPGLHTAWRGGWMLRAGGGWTGRANSVLPLHEDGHHLDALLSDVSRWYRERGLPPTLQVPLPARADLSAALTERAWGPRWGAIVLTADVVDVLAQVPARPELPPVEVADHPDDDWLACYHYRGGVLPHVAPAVLRAGALPEFLRVVDDGATVAICRTATDAGWVGITAVEVASAHRRRGLATHLLRAALERAAQRGVGGAYLQTEDTNTGAITLYGAAGFTRHHVYRYFRPDGVG